MARCTSRTEGKCLTVKEVRGDASGLKVRVLSEVEPARIPVFSQIPHFGESAPSSLGGTSEGLSPFHVVPFPAPMPSSRCQPCQPPFAGHLTLAFSQGDAGTYKFSESMYTVVIYPSIIVNADSSMNLDSAG